jgi:hypothetical protein
MWEETDVSYRLLGDFRHDLRQRDSNSEHSDIRRALTEARKIRRQASSS